MMYSFRKRMSAGKEKDHGKKMKQIEMKDIVKERHTTEHSNKTCKAIPYISNKREKQDRRANGSAHVQ